MAIIHPRQVAQVQGQVVGRYKPPPATQLFCSIVAGWRLRPPTPPRPHFRLAVRAERAGGAWLGRTPLVLATTAVLLTLKGAEYCCWPGEKPNDKERNSVLALLS